MVGAKPSAGHVALEPLHDSATSHAPAAARQLWLVGANASAGHAALEPVQRSAMSQLPADARHSVVAAANVSAGHVMLVPSHRSERSQAPAEARHSVEAGATASAGQALLEPVHRSAASQGPAEARHSVVAGFITSAGHAASAPEQTSAWSHTPFAARQTVPLGNNAHAPPPLQVSSRQPSAVHSESGSVFALTGLHEPSDWPVFADAHAMQAPSHALSQHTPSTQEPLAHAKASVQDAPCAAFPADEPPQAERKQTTRREIGVRMKVMPCASEVDQPVVNIRRFPGLRAALERPPCSTRSASSPAR